MKRLLSYTLIVFTLGLLFNNSANWHYHQLPNGIVVEHAHPYSKGASSADSPYQKHSHSDLEYLILDLIYYSGLLIVILIAGLIVFYGLVVRLVLLKPVRIVSAGNFQLPLLRAPPSK